MHRTNIYLDAEQCEALDRVAHAEGVSRAALIRRLVARALSGRDDDLAGDLAIIDESFGVLHDLEPVARGPDERADHLDRVWRLGA